MFGLFVNILKSNNCICFSKKKSKKNPTWTFSWTNYGIFAMFFAGLQISIQDFVRFASSKNNNLIPPITPGLLVLAPFFQGLHVLFGDVLLFHGLVNQCLVVRQGNQLAILLLEILLGDVHLISENGQHAFHIGTSFT